MSTLTEPARSLDYLQHPERWQFNGPACPLKHIVEGTEVGLPASDLSDKATVICNEGRYYLRVGQLVAMPMERDGWVRTTPEAIIEAGWRVD